MFYITTVNTLLTISIQLLQFLNDQDELSMVLIDQFDILPSCPGQGIPIPLDHSQAIDDPRLPLLKDDSPGVCNCTSKTQGALIKLKDPEDTACACNIDEGNDLDEQLQQLDLGSQDEDQEVAQYPCDIIVAGSFMRSEFQTELEKCRCTTDYKTKYNIQLYTLSLQILPTKTP